MANNQTSMNILSVLVKRTQNPDIVLFDSDKSGRTISGILLCSRSRHGCRDEPASYAYFLLSSVRRPLFCHSSADRARERLVMKETESVKPVFDFSAVIGKMRSGGIDESLVSSLFRLYGPRVLC